MNVLIAQLAPCGPLSNFALLINQNMWASGKVGKKEVNSGPMKPQTASKKCSCLCILPFAEVRILLPQGGGGVQGALEFSGQKLEVRACLVS